ncbi:MAG: hypothetical protein RIQ81_1974 [Pseudomonadota bacterium]|jgi:hypothetical protein
MIIKKSISVLGVLAACGLATSFCGKEENKNEEEAVTATSLGELKLASAFRFELPDSIKKAAGTSSKMKAARMTGKKSSEACRTVDNINKMFGNLASIGGTFCHLEAESGQIKFGTKYKIQLVESGGSMEMPLWIDNSQAGKLTIYMCEAGKIKEKISLSSSSSAGAKGTVHYKGSASTQSWNSSVAFDFTTAGLKILAGQNLFSDGSNNYSQDNMLELRDSGVSLMKTASKGTHQDGTFEDRGAVKHNGTMGQALFKGTGTHNSSSYNFSSRATFDSDGYKVANTTATSDILVAATDLPAFLPAGFTIEDPTGWDCATEETVTVDMVNGSTAAAHAACNTDHSSGSNCWGDDFEQGDNETIE